jgi:hypothetical protein
MRFPLRLRHGGIASAIFHRLQPMVSIVSSPWSSLIWIDSSERSRLSTFQAQSQHLGYREIVGMRVLCPYYSHNPRFRRDSPIAYYTVKAPSSINVLSCFRSPFLKRPLMIAAWGLTSKRRFPGWRRNANGIYLNQAIT